VARALAKVEEERKKRKLEVHRATDRAGNGADDVMSTQASRSALAASKEWYDNQRGS